MAAARQDDPDARSAQLEQTLADVYRDNPTEMTAIVHANGMIEIGGVRSRWITSEGCVPPEGKTIFIAAIRGSGEWSGGIFRTEFELDRCTQSCPDRAVPQ